MALALDFSGEVEHRQLKIKTAEPKSNIIKLVMSTRFCTENEASLAVEGHVLIVELQSGQQLHEVVGWQFDGVLSSGQKCGNPLEVRIVKIVLHPVGLPIRNIRNRQLPGACFDLIRKENEPIVFISAEPDVGAIDTVEDGV